MRGFICLCLVSTAIGWNAAAPAQELPLVPANQEPALRMLADAAFRLDVEGIELARDRLDTAPTEETPAAQARRLYLLALAEWHLSQATSADVARAAAAARRADDVLGTVIGLEPALAAAWALRNRVNYLRFVLGELPKEEAIPGFRETAARARALAPNDPLVALVDGIILLNAPEASEDDETRGLARVRHAIDLLDTAAPADPHADIWLPVAWNWLGSTHLGRGEVGAARKAFAAALEVRPDYAYVRRAMLPRTERVLPASLAEVPADGWLELVEDPIGDGRLPGLADLRRLAWRPHAADNRVWFRLELAGPPDPKGFGANVALDVDGSQENGRAWWASDGGFRYDRLVTVWVTVDAEGAFRGAVGSADHQDVAEGRFITSPPGTVTFAVDAEARAILIGVRRDAFGSGGDVQVVATVGSPTDWNDSTPETVWVTLSPRSVRAQDVPRPGTVDEFTEAFVSAARAFDVEAWSRLVAEDVVMMAPNGRVVEGRDGFRKLWTRSFEGQRGTNPLTVAVKDVRSQGDLAVVRAEYGPDGADPVGQYVWALERDAQGTWILSWWIFNRKPDASAAGARRPPARE